MFFLHQSVYFRVKIAKFSDESISKIVTLPSTIVTKTVCWENYCRTQLTRIVDYIHTWLGMLASTPKIPTCLSMSN
jgi:hypothetical protein